MVTYPNGYGTQRVSLQRLREIHQPRMHPEYARRLFAWIESRGGVMGIGGGWRTTPSNTSEASRNGQSFHQYQNFSGGPRSYAAVDLVATNPSGGNHRAVRWDEVPRQGSTHPDIQRFGLWANTNNAHHLQPVPLDGWGSWNNAGRPNLTTWPMTGPPPPPPPQPPIPPLRPIPGASDVFQPIAPFRNSDTRGFGGAGVAPIAHRFGLNPGVFPANTVAVAMNVAVVNPAGPGFCTVWTAGPRPDVSCINFPAGGAHNGAIVVGIQDLAFFIFASQTAHLICDITGFWTP